MAIDTGDSYYGYDEVNTLEEHLRDMIPVSANVNALNTTNKHHDPTHVGSLDALHTFSQHRSTNTSITSSSPRQEIFFFKPEHKAPNPMKKVCVWEIKNYSPPSRSKRLVPSPYL